MAKRDAMTDDEFRRALSDVGWSAVILTVMGILCAMLLSLL